MSLEGPVPGFSRRGSRPLRRDTPARVLEDRIIAPQAPLLIGKRHVKRGCQESRWRFEDKGRDPQRSLLDSLHHMAAQEDGGV